MAQVGERWTKKPGAVLVQVQFLSAVSTGFFSQGHLSVQTLLVFVQLPCVIACISNYNAHIN